MKRPKKPQPQRPPDQGGASNAPAVPKPAAARTRAREWLFRLIALVIVPLLVLGALEGALRLAGCGYHTGFFEKVRAGDKDFLVNNEDFSRRFFPPQLVRWPEPIMFKSKKSADTCRIFILGESAARGEPMPPYGAGRYLEALLRERFPGVNFEIINTGITAINSNVILPIARDCAKQNGDIWIIYMGNNEMVGPFGAATVFGVKAPPLKLIRMSLAIQKTRLAQLLMDLSRKLGGNPKNASWGGMKMFLANQVSPDDPSTEIVRRNFKRNLQDIVRVGLGSGVKIILSTVAVNLKDCPPFASMPATNLPAADRVAFDGLCTNGCSAVERGDFMEAAQLFEGAARLNPKSADVQYRWGECLLHLTNYASAREHLQLACDFDALPFRTSSQINGLIRETGKQFAGPRLNLLDAVSALESNTAAGICGQETFYEHVHFTFEGNYQLARAWAGQVEQFLPETIRSRAVGDWASQETCGKRLALSDWNRCAVVESVIWRLHRPPMSHQFNNAWRQEMLQQESKDLRQRMNPATEANAREIYEAAFRLAPGDHYLHENFAEFLSSANKLKEATAEWRKVCELLPRHCGAYYQAGRFLEMQNQWAEARTALRRAIQLRPSLTEAWFELGCVNLAEEKFKPALEAFDRAWRLEPQSASYCAFVGKALSKLNRRADAIEHYRRAILLEPDLAEAHFALGDELAAGNQIGEASSEYAEVIRLQPANALAHQNLGVMLARQGRFDEALREFEETLRLNPGNQLAKDYYERVQDWKKRKR